MGQRVSASKGRSWPAGPYASARRAGATACFGSVSSNEIGVGSSERGRCLSGCRVYDATKVGNGREGTDNKEGGRHRLTIGESDLATATRSSRIVAALPDPVKQMMWNLTFYTTFGNAPAGTNRQGIWLGKRS